MLEYFMLYFVVIAIFYYKKSIIKNYYIIDHNNFLLDSFNILKKVKYSKCRYFSQLKCIKFNSKNIPNLLYFISNNINYSYKQSSLTLIKQFTNIKENSTKKFKMISKIFNLKIYGFKNVIVSKEGSIHSECWDITTTGGCKCNNLPNIIINKSHYPQYNKIISISHRWGNAVYHSIGECLPKIGYYIPELLKDETIKIHTYRSASVKYLKYLGFNNSRIVYGNIFVKNLLSLEKGKCGSPPPIIHIQSLRKYIRDKIISKPKYHIIIIKRFGIRDIINFNDVYNSVNNRFRNKNIAIFYPNTTFADTLNYFKYAKLIVAPHGAGLSNMIISENCRIVEFISNNLCLTSLGRSLGLEYYGIYERVISRKFLVNISLLNKVLKIIDF